jgi:O-antigen/teichoic acid export membrane protein
MRIASRTILIMLDRASGVILRLLMGVILVRLIDKDLLGSFRQVLMVGGFMAMLGAFSVPDSTFFFLPGVDASERKRRLSQIFFLAMTLGLTASAIVFLTADQISSAFKSGLPPSLIRLFALYPLLEICRQTLSSAMLATDRPLLAAVVSFVATLARFAVVIALFAVGQSLTTVLTAYIAVEIFSLSLLLVAMGLLGGLQPSLPDLKFCREVFGYCLPLALSYGVGLLSRWLDRGLIALYFSAERFAEYDSGARELPFITIFSHSLAIATMPTLVTLYRQGEVSQMAALFVNSVRCTTVILLPLFVWAIISSWDIIAALYTTDYINAVYPFIAYAFIIPLRVAIYSTVLRAMGRTLPILWGAAGSCAFNIISSCLFLHWGGDSLYAFTGPAICTVFSAYLLTFYMAFIIQQALRSAGYIGPIFPLGDYLLVLLAAVIAGSCAWLVVSLVSVDFLLSIAGHADVREAWLVTLAHSIRAVLSLLIISVVFLFVGKPLQAVRSSDLAILSRLVSRLQVKVRIKSGRA